MSLGFQPDSFSPAFGPPEFLFSVATIGGFQVGPFQPIPVYQQVRVAEEQPTGGWKRKQDYFPPDLSREEREARIRADRIRRGILEPEKPKAPEAPEKPVQRDDSLDLDFLSVDLAGLELKLIKAEMERKFPERKQDMPDKEVQERLLYALEYAQKRRVALLLLLL